MDSMNISSWIPVEERLPNEQEFKKACSLRSIFAEFIVMIDGSEKPTTLDYCKDGTWMDEFGTEYNVIAWMPLPEPYRK